MVVVVRWLLVVPFFYPFFSFPTQFSRLCSTFGLALLGKKRNHPLKKFCVIFKELMRHQTIGKRTKGERFSEDNVRCLGDYVKRKIRISVDIPNPTQAEKRLLSQQTGKDTNQVIIYRIGHNYFTPPPNSNDLNPCENFLKNRKFPGKIIFTGQKTWLEFCKEGDPPPPNSNGVDPCKKVRGEWGVGEIVVSNTVMIFSFLFF